MGDFPEHTTIPPLKLIDFGLSVVNAEQSEQQNLLAASRQIYFLITRRFSVLGVQNGYHNGIYTMATDILPSNNGQARYPTLDINLRDLVAQCLATDEGDRPSLIEVLAICKNAVETKTPGVYGFNAPAESDYWIGRLLQEILVSPLESFISPFGMSESHKLSYWVFFALATPASSRSLKYFFTLSDHY